MKPGLSNEELSSELDVAKNAEVRDIIATTRRCVYCERSFAAVGSANVCRDEECQYKLDSYYIDMLMLTASQEQDYRDGTVEYGDVY